MSYKRKTQNQTRSAILLVYCADRKGLIASVTEFIYRSNGNIIRLDQHVDSKKRIFFMRAEWDLNNTNLPVEELGVRFQAEIAEKFGMQWKLYFSDETPRIAVFVSKLSHCLYDILSRYQAKEWDVEIPLIISNHPDLETVAKGFGIDYYVFPITKTNKRSQEQKQLALLKEHNIETIVLARYMQIMTNEFVKNYPNRIINIHHSFLPAFPGAQPYHSAYERGVKIIGATSHYVTSELDAGPIIEQDIVNISHKDTVMDLIRKGRDLEKVVLARTIWHHLRRKVLVHDNRTIVFE
ncbi:TPA: formyltetrahydrofolate deformylase [Candidatus Poribacteria bacterium]|nr:formyltetrahydrofolate deformylase [Candidatus Poribacteria bacterium]